MAMQIPRKLLLAAPGEMGQAPSQQPMHMETQVVVILAALLSALVCVVGMALIARCAWLRRYSWDLPMPVPAPVSIPEDKGLSENAILALPKLSFQPGAPGDRGGNLYDDCPICLVEFVGGDEVRVLPQCGHQFHVACVDPWLVSRSSCPSCRRVLDPAVGAAVPSCDKCSDGSAGPPSPAAAPGLDVSLRAQGEMEDTSTGGE